MTLSMGVNTSEDSSAARFLTVLIAGFALLIALLGASVWVGVDAIRSTEATANRLVQEQRATLRLIEDIQQEQDSLSAIFYSLALDQGVENRAITLRKLDGLEANIRSSIDAGLISGRTEAWKAMRSAVDAFVAEGRSVIRSGERPGVAFFGTHEDLINELGRLAAINFDATTAAEKKQTEGAGERVRSSLQLLAAALLTALAGSVATVWTVVRMFRQLQWQRSELAHLSSRTMADQEETARRFSRELHDEFGQTLNAIEASLVSIHHARQYDAARTEDALVTIKAAIGNARDLSQLLRPSILDDFGLDTSLAWLADGFSQRTGLKVDYVSTAVQRTDGETETQLFRISQEALTNVARHAEATFIRMELVQEGNTLTLTISDNGKGMSPSKTGPGGLGLVGMRARARAAEGTLTVSSTPGMGVTIRAQIIRTQIELKQEAAVAQDSNHTGR
jgi:signal transduction histidine kinase